MRNPVVKPTQNLPRSSSLKVWEVLGPGLITGASDDDPSGIATYAQAGAKFGYGIGWTLLFTYPLMCAIQLICAQIGRVTGHGIGGNLRRYYPKWLLNSCVALLVIANTINLGADLGAMGAALNLLISGPLLLYVGLFSILSIVLEVFVRYSRYVSLLKWLTLSLFAYVATAFIVDMPWLQVIKDLLLPQISLKSDYITVVVAVFGTTISPYLFFWQAGSEVEREAEIPGPNALRRKPLEAENEFQRMRWDTFVGMGFSNAVALFIVLTTAATLNAHGLTDIQTSAQAAEALRPIAGHFAYTLFALGIIGTGLLALPVLAGSAAYALGEAQGWPVGLTKKPRRATRFYFIIAVSTVIGACLNFIGLDPIKALFWSAVINGVVAVPLMVMLMFMATNRKVMGKYHIGRVLAYFGWLATSVMAVTVVGMFATWNNQ